MKIWAVANQKGGVGKTTTAITLAGHLAARGMDALLVDLDPHGSLTSYFGHDPDNIGESVYSLFQGEPSSRPSAASLVRSTAFDHLYVMPASTALATLDRQLGSKEGMGLVIGRSLAQLSDRFAHVFIDCPPVLGVLMINALAASNFLIVPVQTEFLALKGLDRMMHTLSMVMRARGRALEYLIVPTMFDRHTRASIESLNTLREQHGEALWRSVIPVDTQFREASQVGAPLSLLNRQARGSVAYAALLHELTQLGAPIREQKVQAQS